jgi:hypothetical protein
MIVRTSAMLIALASVLTVSAAAAGAAQAEPTRLEASAGIGGYVDPAKPVEVSVVISSDLLFVGVLEAREREATVRILVEVPAGTSKSYRLVLPSPISGSSVRLRLFPDGSDKQVANLSLNLRLPAADLLVGVTGDGIESGLLETATVLGTGAKVVAIEVMDDQLEGDLSPLAYLVMYPVVPASSALEEWMREGGRVVVDASHIGELATDLDAGRALEGSAAAIYPIGEGEVVAVPQLLSVDAAGWSSILRPAQLIISPRDTWQTPEPQLMQAASSVADQRLPTLPWLLAAVVGFAVVIGPLNFMVLRRVSRRELAWFTIPAISLLFVTGFWVAGRQRLQLTILNHATVIVAGAEDVTGRTAIAMAAGGSGTKTVSFPEGWVTYPTQPANLFDQFGNPIAGSVGTAISPEEIRFDLDQLGIAAMQAIWTPDDIRLPVISVGATGNRFEITADNPSQDEFWAWGIGGRHGAQVASGSLAAGGTASHTFTSVKLEQTGFVNLADAVINAHQLWNDQTVYERLYPLSTAAGYMVGDLDAFFFGYTYGHSLEVSVDGRPMSVGGSTIVIVPFQLPVESLEADPIIQADLVGTGRQSWVDSGPGYLMVQTDEMTVRFSIPEGVDGDPVFRASNMFGELPRHFQAWNWQTGVFEEIAPNDQVDLSLYQSGGGEVLIRAQAGGPDDGLPEFYELGMSPYAVTLEFAA